MRFIHIADVHLGARPAAGPLYSARRPAELWKTLEHVLDVCEEEQTDLLLVAGDLFHRQPLVRELMELDSLFSRLTRTKVVLIAGNHDYIRRDSAYLSFRWSDCVYPLFGEELECVDFPELQTAVYGLSYHRREITEPLYDGMKAAGREPFEILLAHGGDERHIPLDVQKLKRSGFDYIALGHIHKPQVLAADFIIYPGALEPVDRKDTGAHGYVKGEITRDGVRTQWIPCACREYVELELEVEQSDTNVSVRRKLKDAICASGEEHMYSVTLKGRRNGDIRFDTKHLAEELDLLEAADETVPAYDMDRLYRENRENILGQYIARFDGCAEGSEDALALCEGVEALLAARGRGSD